MSTTSNSSPESSLVVSSPPHAAISQERRLQISRVLQTIEREERIRILYACESGSRAWGFASEESDYDVRFIYVRPQEAYLDLDPPRDHLEYLPKNTPLNLPDSLKGLLLEGEGQPLDIVGWDIYKALRLLRKSNPPLIEWLWSPEVYIVTPYFHSALCQVVQQFYSAPTLIYGYSHMAKGNYQQYIRGKSEVLLKKYLYVLRPLIQVLYIKQKGDIPPTHFDKTLNEVQVPIAVRRAIMGLILQKCAGLEMGKGQPVPLLNDFIEDQLRQPVEEVFDPQRLLAFGQELRRLLKEALALFVWEEGEE